MRIFLLRHAEAQDAAEVERDEDRALTAKGVTRLRKASRGLRRLDIFPDRILTSPIKRAVETAEIIAEELGFAGDIEAVDELSPDTRADELAAVLHEITCAQVLLVGHQPLLGDLAAELVGGAAGARVGIKKGGFVRIDVESWNEEPPGRLRWLFTAKHLSWMKKKKKKKDKKKEKTADDDEFEDDAD